MSEADEHSSLMDKFNEKIHEYKEASSSDSEDEKPMIRRARKIRLFGRKDPVHTVIGGSIYADIVLWRNKQMSAGIFAGVTVVWLLFAWMGYHFLTFVCHSFIFLLAVLFLWSSVASFVNRSPLKFPEVILPEDLCLYIAHRVRFEINEALITFRYVASGGDLRTFLMVIGGLWSLSVIGSWFSFLTLSYIVFVLQFTVPALFEKIEDHVGTLAEAVTAEVNKQYAVLDAMMLQKIPRGPLADKKGN